MRLGGGKKTDPDSVAFYFSKHTVQIGSTNGTNHHNDPNPSTHKGVNAY